MCHTIIKARYDGSIWKRQKIRVNISTFTSGYLHICIKDLLYF